MTKISNPLTIIGVFSTLSEGIAIGVLPLLSENLQLIFIWFVILFPVLLVILFFLTLNINPSVLYSPSDFKNDASYLEHIKLTNQFKKALKEKSDSDDRTFTFSEIIEIINNTSENLSEDMREYAYVYSVILSRGEEGVSISELSEATGYSQKIISTHIIEWIENESLIEVIDEHGNMKYIFKP